MLMLQCDITIGNLSFDYCEAVEVSSSWEQFTDTCKITMPTKFKDKNKNIISLDRLQAEKGVFKPGDKVTVKLGYVPQMWTVFEGYLKSANPNTPLIFECEDASYLLKRRNIASFSQKGTTLAALINHIVAGIVPVKVLDAKIGDFRVSNESFVNIVDVLDLVKNQFGFSAWFRNGELYVDYPSTRSTQTGERPTHEFDFQRNVVDSNLSYEIVEPDNIAIKGTSIKLNNTKIDRYAYYDTDGTIKVGSEARKGEQRQFNFIELSQAELDEKIKGILPTIMYNGFSGSFNTFGFPFVQHGDKVKLIDRRYPERDGSYLVRAVGTSFGNGGFRQNITLDTKIS
jgi:hypothetical protein